MYNDQLEYKVVIWAFFGMSLQTEKVALTNRVVSWFLPSFLVIE